MEELDEALKQIEELKEEIQNLNSKLINLYNKVTSHQHNGVDETSPLENTMKLKDEAFLIIGNGGISSRTSSGVKRFYFAAGDDMTAGYGNTTKNTQLQIEHLDSGSSFFYGFRPPIWTGSGVSISSSSSTFTDSGKSWTADELIGAYINVYDSSGVFQCSRTITDNTATTITVDSNFSFTDADSSYILYVPVYNGSADYIWKRGYVDEGTAGGMRFGYGVTNGGQNGLLYMDSVGDLYWRNKAGSSTKLN